MSILIRHATIVTVDPTFTIHDDGAIFIEGARIVAVGPDAEVSKVHTTADRVIDGTGRVVTPGFVSCHNHVGYTLFRGRAEDASLDCVNGMYLPMISVATREERRKVGSMTYAELLKSGVTTTLEMEEEADVYAPFVDQIGCRSFMGIMLQDADIEGMARGQYRFDSKVRERELARAVRLAEDWHGSADGRIQAIITPNLTVSSSVDLLRASRREADRLGLRTSIHVGWGEDEYGVIERVHGTSPYAFAHDCGLMEADTVLAHCYMTTPEDITLLANSGASVCHCPLMNSVRGHIAPIGEYRRRGVRVALGIDNMFADHFDVVRASVMVARIKEHSAVVMKAPEALRLATIEGARALGIAGEIGSIEIGKRADLMILNFRAFGLTPMLDPVQNIVYHAHSKDIETVMVDGQIVVDDHRLVRANEEDLIAEAIEASASAWGRFVDKHGGIIARYN